MNTEVNMRFLIVHKDYCMYIMLMNVDARIKLTFNLYTYNLICMLKCQFTFVKRVIYWTIAIELMNQRSEIF